MGTWNSGIYGNDTASDYIRGVVDFLCNGVRNVVKHDYTFLHPSMVQSDIVICNIDLLNAVCSREGLHILLPKTEEIMKWKAKYMEVWEFCIDECKPQNEYKIERKDILNKSFDTLIELAKLRDSEDE